MRNVIVMKSELKDLQKEEEELLAKEEEVEADIKRLSDPLYMARYTREKYLYSREGEIILRFEDE